MLLKKNSNKPLRVLSIDGGGIRGIIPGQVLVSLERKMQKLANNPDLRIADCFDLIAGTSTGGILTLAYLTPNGNKPKFTAEQVVNLYLERGDEIFNIPVTHRIRTSNGVTDEKYPAGELELALKDYFGDVMLGDLLKPCLITSYDIKRRQAHFFTSHDAKIHDDHNFLVRDVARATSAAPTYFECSRIKSFSNVTYPLIDGGVFANNPALCAFAEIQFKNSDVTEKIRVTPKDIVILSLGTGFSKKSYDYNEAKDWGLVGWVRPIIDIMMSGASEVVDYQLKQIFEAAEVPGQYLRLNIELPIEVSPDMDDASRQNVNALKELGTELAQNSEKELEKFLKLL